jgi:hypothetical protein
VINFEQHPEYLAAQAEHQAAVMVANANEDELAKLRADYTWLQKSQTIKEKVTAEAAKATHREAILAEIKEKYPLLPASFFESIPDPDKLMELAKEMYEKMDATVRKNTNSWGGGTGAPAGAGQSDAPKKIRDRQYYNNLVDRVNKNEGGKDGAVKEFKDMIWREKVTPWRDAAQK